MKMISKIGELVGEKIIDRATKKFGDLEEALEHLYWWEKEYSIEKPGMLSLLEVSVPYMRDIPSGVKIDV
ncbi:hypothetical protein AKJ64_03365 [candidate division MSBL1 archaeon SCGC-AAA259E17]|uniref:Uncharacterized protein n=1 Tax=candidate division MSBL1 archaeon SCGC-AAA259E17 TaxID=1698263 RepID=A0A133UDR1_9EURY|nr:hypothetical protein AKJ64_03365 [candidate division MSBL1 archaeon SCGC-AAA259E17]